MGGRGRVGLRLTTDGLDSYTLCASQLQEEELRLRTTIDTAIASVRKGDILMDMATRQVRAKRLGKRGGGDGCYTCILYVRVFVCMICVPTHISHAPPNQPTPSHQQNTPQGLVNDITEASRVLLELNAQDTAQFRQRLDDQFFKTSVGSVMPESDGAFEEVGLGVGFCSVCGVVMLYVCVRG